MSEERFDYVARKSCGCAVGVCADVKGWEKDTAKSVAEWIKKGLSVERKSHVETVEILKDGLGCVHVYPEEQPKLFGDKP